jgi:eukaryotic-like serine/threonine-protein kinase
VVEVGLAGVGLKVASQRQVDMATTCSSAGAGRIRVELAVDGTRVASYTGAAFDARGCGAAAFHYGATDPRATAFHAGFERFTASEPATRRRTVRVRKAAVTKERPNTRQAWGNRR